MIVVRAALVPVRVLGFSFRAGYRTGRLVGYRRIALVAVGVAVGLVVAPVPGRELRARLRRRLDAAPYGSDAELAERVRFELSHHPRTWHLAQPDVEVADGRVSLRGRVGDASARHELVAAAAGVRGVAGVVDHLEVPGTSAPG